MESGSRHGIALYAAFAVWGLSVASSACAENHLADPPEIVVTGTAELSIAPTEAAFSVEISTAAPTAAAASADNARLSKAVMEALQAMHVGSAEIASSHLTVGPRWTYDEATHRQKRTAYEATNSIEIKTSQLDRLGIYIDGVLNAGATGVSQISFAAKTAETAARRQALTEAIAEARADAETMARASGGKLGELLLLSSEGGTRFGGPRLEEVSVTAQRVSATVDTQIVLPQIKVSATVLGHWKFVP